MAPLGALPFDGLQDGQSQLERQSAAAATHFSDNRATLDSDNLPAAQPPLFTHYT